MLASSIPTKFPIPWGVAATSPDIRPIPVPSQQGIQTGAASLTDGFPPACFNPTSGVGPFGQDFNGIFNIITLWNQWQQAGAPVSYDSTFASQINGYPAGGEIQAANTPGSYWYSLVDNNITNPDSGGANWLPLGVTTTGDVKWRPTGEVLPGWVKANATTIGNAVSGATQLAAASAARLFAWLWTNFSNTQCPVLGGRGASAAADFAANKQITVLDLRGMGIEGVDTMGGAPSTRLSGVPVTTGSSTAPGSYLGENLHSLANAENAFHVHGAGSNDPGHLHGIPGVLGTATSGNQGSGGINITGAATSAATGLSGTGLTTTIFGSGSSTPHNTVQLSMLGTWYISQ